LTGSRGVADVVILGNTGFVGARLQAYLAGQGARVTGFGSRELDLRQADALPLLDGVLGPSSLLVVMSAAGAGSGMTALGLADNVQMVANLAAYLESRPPRKCMYFSSDAVYPMIGTPVSETTPLDVSSFYALSKYAGERLMQQVLGRTPTKVVLLRPTAMFGPGDTHNAYGPNRFARAIARHETVQLFGAGEETRDHVYVDDVVRLVADLDSADLGGTVNIATGTSRSFGAVIETLGTLAGLAPAIQSLPRRGEVTHRSFDISRLRDALPSFKFTPFEDALRASLRAAALEVSA
jgi:UDP-glucose 4-epimerase